MKSFFFGPFCLWLHFQEQDARGFTIGFEWRSKDGLEVGKLPRFREWYLQVGYNRSQK